MKKTFMIVLYIISIILITTMNMSIDTKNYQQERDNDISIQLQSKNGLPQGFVYVDEIDPMIINNLRYFTTENFIGKVLPGYFANRAIMTQPAALALKNVNQQLLADGYQIVIYDSYRPQRTVDKFVQWSLDDQDDSQRLKYYPTIDKSLLFELGYIAKKSGHTRGSTVDLSIIKVGNKLKPVEYKLRELQDGRLIFFLDDGTEDFGSSFDLFGQASHPGNNSLIAKEFLKKRAYLAEKMQKHGFKGISTQWWHFTLQNEPYPSTYFDFDVR